jgi:hypothetical protein
LKFLMPEATTLTGSSKTLTAEQQKQLEKAKSNLVFIENKGQWHSDVLYLCRMGGLDAWITKYGVNYTFYKLEEAAPANKNERSLPDKFEHKDYNMIGHRVLMKLQNYNPNPATESKEKQEGYYNYFIGNDPGKHASYVGLYKEAVVKDVYNGIDLRYYFDKGILRYDYVVHPGADPSQIAFTLEGSDKTYVNEKGNLVFTTRFGEVAMAELKTYQADDKKQVLCRFVKRGKVWSIEISNYDTQQLLVIDPLVYSTYIGGSIKDEGYAIAVDGSDNAYVTGFAQSTNYDVTAGAFQTTNGGNWDVFVTKLNASGSALVYSTYIGGSADEMGCGIALDGSGNAYVTGWTYSTNYDVTVGVFQTTNGGAWDVFVTKLDASGSSLVYSTYIGGDNDDRGYGIVVDSSGYAYVTGYAKSNNYDVTTGAFQTAHGGGNYDVFVTKLNASGSALVYSTYIGGSHWDHGYGIAIDGSGNAYVTGYTWSTDYDVTTGAFQTTNGGGGNLDVFITKLNASGSSLVYSTYIGGSDEDRGYGIVLDGSGNAYVTGYTRSTDYDVTAGVFQATKDVGYDVFVTKLNASGSGLVYSTYIGGGNSDYGYGIAVDGSGNAYVTGFTQSTNYDVTPGAFQTTSGGGDVFVTKLNASGSGLVYSTYIGGSALDYGYGIAIDGIDNAYVTGRTQSTDYDVTPGAFQTTNGGDFDIFVTKLCPDPTCNPLPIELLYFEAQPYNERGANKVLLIWETATEINNDYFTIDRSKDAIHFDELCKIKGTGNSYHNISYQFIDENPYEGISYYRLKQTDYDGRFKYSFIRAVTIKFERGGRYSVYPNPSYGTFTLQTKETGVFEILDLTGRLLNAYTIRNNTETIHTNLPTGIYFIREKTSGTTQKLIVE